MNYHSSSCWFGQKSDLKIILVTFEVFFQQVLSLSEPSYHVSEQTPPHTRFVLM